MSVHHRAHLRQKSRERSIAALALFAAMAFMALGGVVIAFYFLPNPALLLGGDTGPDSRRLVETTVGGVDFAVPETLAARIDRKLLGGAERINLQIPWPYDPASARAEPDLARAMLLTIEPRAGQQTHEELFGPIYSVYLETGGADEGIAMRAFKPGAPYADSELAVDYRENPPAVSRCDLKPSLLGPVLCERLFPVEGGLMARLSFPKARIAEWKAMEEAAREAIAAARR
jgi:hypothetical protein